VPSSSASNSPKTVLGPAGEGITLARNIDKHSVAVAYSILSFVVVDSKGHRAGQLCH